MADKTITDVYGRGAADRLAALAIDILCDVPMKIDTHTTKVRAALIEEGRTIMELHGIDWRKLTQAQISGHRAAARRVHDSGVAAMREP